MSEVQTPESGAECLVSALTEKGMPNEEAATLRPGIPVMPSEFTTNDGEKVEWAIIEAVEGKVVRIIDDIGDRHDVLISAHLQVPPKGGAIDKLVAAAQPVTGSSPVASEDAKSEDAALVPLDVRKHHRTIVEAHAAFCAACKDASGDCEEFLLLSMDGREWRWDKRTMGSLGEIEESLAEVKFEFESMIAGMTTAMVRGLTAPASSSISSPAPVSSGDPFYAMREHLRREILKAQDLVTSVFGDQGNAVHHRLHEAFTEIGTELSNLSLDYCNRIAAGDMPAFATPAPAAEPTPLVRPATEGDAVDLLHLQERLARVVWDVSLLKDSEPPLVSIQGRVFEGVDTVLIQKLDTKLHEAKDIVESFYGSAISNYLAKECHGAPVVELFPARKVAV